MLPIMQTLRYTEHSFGPMASLEERIKKIKNVTDLKRINKDIIAYIHLMYNMEPGKRLPRNFQVIGFSKIVFLDAFPIYNCYEITIQEEGENGDNHE